ncbi:cyanoexosortase C [Leptothermofonsia sichuanensis E412]|uniref:cyanoexosortase C n=1 Tax=Leptothermofonsia sichuanensis TaxID=2917832 RepID=UPI001CA61579|nr:cyanoexosortase C [Leptothermofonsia sichuanensis]QZZ19463.1 cyanoexosortase C [Leptothermofonsia sichuanensis E412]
MKWTQVKQVAHNLLQKSVKTNHSRIVTAGLVVSALYLPFWISDLVFGTLHGAASILMAVAIAIGLHRIWMQRQQLSALTVSEEDVLLGHMLIWSGVVLCPFGFTLGEWAQRLIWMIILAGIACSSWGIGFFRAFPLSTFLIFMGIFPSPTAVGKSLWETFMPPRGLERLMAWGGVLGLRAVGQAAELKDDVLITMPGGTVEVAWGCSGFDMATIMAVASLVLGVFLKLRWMRVLQMMVVGVLLALVFNIPRIMLMAIAEARWGKSAFEFWHGVWGGQIFSGILFTVYYYVVMAIAKKNPNKAA